MKASIRGSFHPEEDPQYWKEAVAEFPNTIPRFDDKVSAENFIKKWDISKTWNCILRICFDQFKIRYCRIGSNPHEPALKHSISTLTSWEQIKSELLPRLRGYDHK